MVELHANAMEVAAVLLGAFGVHLNRLSIREAKRVRGRIVEGGLNGPLLLQTDENLSAARQRLFTVVTCTTLAAVLLFVPSRQDGWSPVSLALVGGFVLIELQVVYSSWHALAGKARLDAAIRREQEYQRRLAEQGGRRADDQKAWES